MKKDSVWILSKGGGRVDPRLKIYVSFFLLYLNSIMASMAMSKPRASGEIRESKEKIHCKNLQELPIYNEDGSR